MCVLHCDGRVRAREVKMCVCVTVCAYSRRVYMYMANMCVYCGKKKERKEREKDKREEYIYICKHT
jgi:hypothetical protein